MSKLYKRIILTLALTVCAGVLFSPVTVYAVEEDAVEVVTETAVETDEDISGQETDADAVGDENAGDADTLAPEETEPGADPYDGPAYITPDGTGSVINNVFIEGNGLEFFTFTTKEGNVFYLVIDRLRTQDNVYFLNAVTEQDLLALAEIEGGSGTSASGIPATPGGTVTVEPAETTEEPEEPPAKKDGLSGGTIIFILIGVAAVGGIGYYVKIVRPKQRAADDDDMDFGDDDDSDYDDTGDYGGDDDDSGADDEGE